MKINQNVNTSPVLRVVPFLNSGAFSPWPARLMEMEDWQRPERGEKEILREYNEGWYRNLLDLWDFFSSELDSKAAKPATALRFFYQVTKYVSSEVEKNKAIYRSSQESYLFSMGDQLVVGDLTLGSMIQQDMIVRYVDFIFSITKRV